MKYRTILGTAAVAAATISLAACSEAPNQTADFSNEAYDAGVALESGQDDVDGSAIPELAAIGVTMPQLAYTYDYRWRMPADKIGPLQRRHATLCEQQGTAACQILGMSKSGEEADDVRGVLEMAIASRQARAFGALLEDEAQDSGAEPISAEIASEELSKQIVDTEARLRARTQLRDRLMEVLATRNGTVEELVEAERSVARVNEEIDQARSWLTAMEGRVAFSRITVRYETGMPITNDFLTPVQGALGQIGSILGYIAAFIILFSSIVFPIGLVVWGVIAVQRRLAAGKAPETSIESAA
ncbi:DUF4349 domain-containing protein [Erythrobacter sp. Alg231-14]|uniref:DUF4349 domain-containing protein n=1 Tax=Erythrobacter sp. Alg231-14 TaxID=1922225 RepID=UPI000D54C81B